MNNEFLSDQEDSLDHLEPQPNFLSKLRDKQWIFFDEQWILLILGVLIAFFAIFTRRASFFSFRNLQNVLMDASTIMIIGSGMTLLLISRCMDLSVGSIAIFSSIATAKVMCNLAGNTEELLNFQYSNLGVAISAGVSAGLLSGLFWGLLNGILVVKAKIPPFIATLGTMGIALGLSQVWTGGINVQGVPLPFQSKFGLAKLFNLIPYPVIIAVFIVAVLWVLLSKTRFGLWTYAVGANLEGSRRVGINVDRHRIILYILVGVLAGLVGVIDVARYNTASVGSHANTPMSVVSAVLIGGTSLFGGRGRMIGTVIGALLPAVLANGLIILGINPFWQNVAVGWVLIIAVFLDQLRRSHGK